MGSRFSAPETLQVRKYFCPAVGGVPLSTILTKTGGIRADCHLMLLLKFFAKLTDVNAECLNDIKSIRNYTTKPSNRMSDIRVETI